MTEQQQNPDTESVAVLTVRQQIQDVRDAKDRFIPSRVLPVVIDFFTDAANPYSLAQEVVYDNGIVKVTLEKDFKWDGASIPIWLPIVPWLATMIAMHFFPSPWLWIVTVLLVVYTLRLLPYMQKMGLHARAMCVHDKLYRAQSIPRLIADAIMESILESDGVPWDVRWMIYRRVRQWGWVAWGINRRALRAKEIAARGVEVAAEQIHNDKA